MITTELTRRFQTRRWSVTRQRIHALAVGEQARFTPAQCYNAKQSVIRLNDAYLGNAKWEIKYHKVGPKQHRTYVTRLA